MPSAMALTELTAMNLAIPRILNLQPHLIVKTIREFDCTVEHWCATLYWKNQRTLTFQTINVTYVLTDDDVLNLSVGEEGRYYRAGEETILFDMREDAIETGIRLALKILPSSAMFLYVGENLESASTRIRLQDWRIVNMEPHLIVKTFAEVTSQAEHWYARLYYGFDEKKRYQSIDATRIMDETDVTNFTTIEGDAGYIYKVGEETMRFYTQEDALAAGISLARRFLPTSIKQIWVGESLATASRRISL